MLSRGAGELLLSVLEQKDMSIIGGVLDEFGAEVAVELRGSGLRPSGTSEALVVESDGCARTIDLVWWPEREAYGYFDAADGLVLLDPAAITLNRVDLRWWL